MAGISQQLEVQQLYSRTLEHYTSDLRGFKHDFSNIINTIGGLVDMKDWDSLQNYMNTLNVEFLKITTTDIVNARLKDNPILYGVVLSKLSLAELSGIEFIISIQCELHLKYCDLLDFSRMIGILLDNALEAAADSQRKYVEMEIISIHGQHRISIRNTCRDEVDIHKIFENGYTSKEQHSGIGLNQVMSIINKYRKRGYSMSLQTGCFEHLVTQILTV